MQRLEDGTAREDDIERLLDISDNVFGKSFCALGDAAATPIMSSIRLFRDEYLAHIPGGCPFDHRRSTVFADRATAGAGEVPR